MSADVQVPRASQGSQATPTPLPGHADDAAKGAAKDDDYVAATHLPLPPFVDVTFTNAGTLLNGSNAVMATIHLHNLPLGFQVDLQPEPSEKSGSGKVVLASGRWYAHKSIWPLCVSFAETPEVHAYLQKWSAEVAAVRDKTKCFPLSSAEMVLAKYAGGGSVGGKKLTEHCSYKHHSVSEMVGDVVHVRHFQGKWQIFISTGAASGNFGPPHLNVLNQSSMAKVGTDCVDVRVLMPVRGLPVLAVHDGELNWSKTRRVAFDRLLPPKKRKHEELEAPEDEDVDDEDVDDDDVDDEDKDELESDADDDEEGGEECEESDEEESELESDEEEDGDAEAGEEEESDNESEASHSSE